MRINNNDDSDIKTRLNVSGSTIETLKDTDPKEEEVGISQVSPVVKEVTHR